MAFEHNDNSGSMFKNGYKTEEKHPDQSGSCKIVCPSCGHKQEFKMSAWIKDFKGKSGRFFSIAFSINQPKGSPVVDPKDQVLDDDVPF